MGSSPTPPRCPRLPPELIDAIIDHLHADWRALVPCALVCRSWVPASRHHLFNLLPIYKDNASVVVDLLSSSKCTIADAIVHLRLHRIETMRNLDELACRLPRVTTLTLVFSQMSELNFPWEALSTLLPNIQELRLVSIQVELSLIPRILENCPRLRHIAAARTAVHNNVETSIRTSPRAITPALKSLSMCTADTFSSFLLTHWTEVAPELITLKIRFPLYMGEMLMAVGPSLQILRLHAVNGRLSTDGPSFTHLTQLRSLFIQFKAQPVNFLSTPPFLLEALSHLSSPHLEELTVTMVPLCDTPWRLDYSDVDGWSSLSKVLETPRFLSTMRSLTLRFTKTPYCNTDLEKYRYARECRLWERDDDIKAIGKWIAKRLPSYAARGILDVYKTPGPL